MIVVAEPTVTLPDDVTLPVRLPVTFPVNAAVIVPALKFPDPSRATIAEVVLADVALDVTVNVCPVAPVEH